MKEALGSSKTSVLTRFFTRSACRGTGYTAKSACKGTGYTAKSACRGTGYTAKSACRVQGTRYTAKSACRVQGTRRSQEDEEGRTRADNTGKDLKNRGCNCMDWINVGQETDRLRAVVHMVMNLRVP
jgi:hypothetical protein